MAEELFNPLVDIVTCFKLFIIVGKELRYNVEACCVDVFVICTCVIVNNNYIISLYTHLFWHVLTLAIAVCTLLHFMQTYI